MNDLNLPPRRPLPPDTRDRLRTRVIGGPAPRRAWTRVPLAAAAAVAVLAAGAVIVAQSVGGDPDPATPPAPTTPAPPAEAERCDQASVIAGMEGLYPDVDKWRRVAEVSEGEVTVTAYRDLGGNPFFCVTTSTSVVISNPDNKPEYAPGTRTGTLLTWAAGGVVAGVADPSWTKVGLLIGEQEEGVHTSTVATIEDGLFINIHPTPVGWIEVLDETGDNSSVKEPGDGSRLPSAPPPGVRVQDRRTDTGSAAEFLATCFAETKGVPEPREWRPGAFVADLSAVVMVRRGDRVGMCFNSRSEESTPEQPLESYEFTEFTLVPTSRVAGTRIPTRISPGAEGQSLVVGVVPPGAESLRLSFSDDVEVEAQVADGTFVAVVPPGTMEATLTGGVAKNGSGKVVYEGEVGALRSLR